MIEQIVLAYLSEALDVPVYAEKPDQKQEEYVLIEKTGSSVENFIYSATLALKSHAQSKYKASELNEKVKKAMDEIILLDSISKSKLNTDYDFTDTTKKEYRYQAVYDLVY